MELRPLSLQFIEIEERIAGCKEAQDKIRVK